MMLLLIAAPRHAQSCAIIRSSPSMSRTSSSRARTAPPSRPPSLVPLRRSESTPWTSCSWCEDGLACESFAPQCIAVVFTAVITCIHPQHWWDYSVPGMVEVGLALTELKKAGLIKCGAVPSPLWASTSKSTSSPTAPPSRSNHNPLTVKSQSNQNSID